MASKITCMKCLDPIQDKRLLYCCDCKQPYHIECVNVSEQRFYNTLTKEHRATWQCPACMKSEVPRIDITDTPARPVDGVNIMRRGASAIGSEEVRLDSDALDLIGLLRDEMRAGREEMKEFRGAISSLTSALGICTSRLDDLTGRVEIIEKQQREFTAANYTPETSSLEKTISELKIEINDRDQNMLSNDIEIAGIPEEKHERATHLLITVAAKLGFTLEERDLVSVERAGPVRVLDTQQHARPRPLVARLARRSKRDEILAAARVRRKITTEGLGLVSKVEHRVYINERLTRANRQIFYKARSEALSANWKYVWTRDGKIYARKEHGGVGHRLRSENDIARLFGGT